MAAKALLLTDCLLTTAGLHRTKCSQWLHLLSEAPLAAVARSTFMCAARQCSLVLACGTIGVQHIDVEVMPGFDLWGLLNINRSLWNSLKLFCWLHRYCMTCM
jgi:hypothetical protein